MLPKEVWMKNLPYRLKNKYFKHSSKLFSDIVHEYCDSWFMIHATGTREHCDYDRNLGK